MPFSRNAELVESWNWYRTAPRTGFQANDGVRGKECTIGSSARSKKPCSPVGTFAAAVRAPAPGARTSRARHTAATRAENIVLPRFRHARARGRPSKEGRQALSRCEDERVGARTAGELYRSGEPVFRRAAGKRERGPTEYVERKRVVDEASSQGEVADPDGLRDARDSRRHDELEPLDRLEAARPVRLARFASAVERTERHVETLLDLRRDVVAVQIAVLH